jgi:hypothetical protein
MATARRRLSSSTTRWLYSLPRPAGQRSVVKLGLSTNTTTSGAARGLATARTRSSRAT